VLKDGVEQAGGTYFASKVGELRQFHINPKYWRMVAAITFDIASLLEIISRTFPSIVIVLPVARISTILKNIRFLMASASRAVIHQSLITKKLPLLLLLLVIILLLYHQKERHQIKRQTHHHHHCYHRRRHHILLPVVT
jgi:predicted neutral ceramidase superfamily lipid hydrolase